jgi:hypothetical protein
MRRLRIESSTLASVLYLPAQRELQVEFRSGEIYQYADVPFHAYGELLAAPSKGTYFNLNIRNRYDFRQLIHSQPVPTAAS